jgi:hypothetical protein
MENHQDIVKQIHQEIDKAKLPPEAVAKLNLARQSIVRTPVQPNKIDRVAMLGTSGTLAHVELFKNFGESPRSVSDLLDTYGELILKLSGQVGSEIWRRKLVTADRGVADSFNVKLQSGRFSTFRGLVESFEGAVERLVALHLANALIHHRVSFGDAKNMDVFEWPHTQGLATGKVPYSVIPLVSAYCDPDVWRVFPTAFRHRVLGTLACGRKDVEVEFKAVVDSVCEVSS